MSLLHSKFFRLSLIYSKLCDNFFSIPYSGIKLPKYISVRTCISNIKLEDLQTSNYCVSNNKIKYIFQWGYSIPDFLGYPDCLNPLKGKEQKLIEDESSRSIFSEDIDITDISCGHGFTVFGGTSNNMNMKLFGTGLNYDSQIGYHLSHNGSILYVLYKPLPINLPCPSGTKLIQVDCGRSHTVVVTDKGVFSLGNNSFGQCGYQIVTNEGTKMPINTVQNIKNIKSVSCGQDHTIFLNNNGEVFSCGWGADGQTGLGHYKSQGIPTQLEGDIKGEKIIQISGSSDTVLAISDKGDLFGWGNSEYEQLKLATNDKQLNIPRHLPLSKIGKVTHAAAGGTMCAVINNQGQVFVWGYGLLGYEANVSHITEPYALPQNLFSNKEYNSDVKVDSISCGLNYFAAITKEKNLYMWGKNRSSNLCNKYNKDIYFPSQIFLPAEVVKISCGVNHVAILCEKTI